MSDLVVTVAVTYPDGTTASGQATATVTGEPVPEPVPDFIRRSQTDMGGYR